jgi:hypothetical protein
MNIGTGNKQVGELSSFMNFLAHLLLKPYHDDASPFHYTTASYSIFLFFDAGILVLIKYDTKHSLDQGCAHFFSLTLTAIP